MKISKTASKLENSISWGKATFDKVSVDFRQIAEPGELSSLAKSYFEICINSDAVHESSSYGKATETVSLDSDKLLSQKNEFTRTAMANIIELKLLPKHSVELKFHESSSYGKATETVSPDSDKLLSQEINLLKLQLLILLKAKLLPKHSVILEF